MIAINVTELKSDAKKFLDKVENDNEILIIKRNSGEGTVAMSMEMYNSIMETNHIMSSSKNIKRLEEGIRQAENGETKTFTLDDI